MIERLRCLLLAAGLGTRLRPYTDEWPKCLMPIQGQPLLQYWLDSAREVGAERVFINLHHLPEIVESFLENPELDGWVEPIHERDLKGTAGTIRQNLKLLEGGTTLLVHADNFCITNFRDFVNFHKYYRPKHCPITMMTFRTWDPSSCGIVEVDSNNVVCSFFEKASNPPGNLANGAVYLLESEVLDWLSERPSISDFSTEVLPNFIGRIATWYNDSIHIDIGSIESFIMANSLAVSKSISTVGSNKKFLEKYGSHPTYELMKSKLEN